LYGAFPAPRLAPVSVNHREEMLRQLAREVAQRDSGEGRAATRREQ
jgi:hypothetical protein